MIQQHSPLIRPLDSQSGFQEWTRWLIGQLGVCLLLFVAYLAGPNPATNALYLLLFAITGSTLWKSYRDSRLLDAETQIASAQVKQMAELNDLARFIETASPSLFRSHIQSLYTIFQTHPEIQQDNLIEILHTRLLARNRTAELFASLLITIGLIGTIVGLVIMMASLKNTLLTLSSTDAQFMTKVTASLGGLETAFYTTLIGAVFGGVILKILTSIVEAQITRYIAHLAELTEIHVLPMMRRIAIKLEKSGYYERTA